MSRRAHPYHPSCGCARCDEDDLAAERREAAIATDARLRAAGLMSDEDFAADAFGELSDDDAEQVLRTLGRFLARVEPVPGDDDITLAGLAGALWINLRPYLHAAALERATDEATTAHDRRAQEAPST